MTTFERTTSPREHAGLGESASAFAADLVGPAMKRLDVSQLLAQSGSAASLAVDQIRLGQATIGRVNIQGVNATLDAGDTRLEGFRMVLRVTVGLRFRVFGIRRQRSVTFGFPFNVGTVTIPRLDDIQVAVPSATITGTQAEVQPVNALDLGGGQFSDLRLDGTLLPAAGFGLAGLGLGEVKLRDVAVPATFTERLSIGTFTPDQPLRLPSTTVTNVQLPTVAAPRVSSSAPIGIPDIRPQDLEQTAGIDLIILSVTLFVRPIVDIEIAALTINDIEAASSIQRIGLEDISSPVTISGLSLGDITLRQVTINQISV
jgi:hypothetical protein